MEKFKNMKKKKVSEKKVSEKEVGENSAKQGHLRPLETTRPSSTSASRNSHEHNVDDWATGRRSPVPGQSKEGQLGGKLQQVGERAPHIQLGLWVSQPDEFGSHRCSWVGLHGGYDAGQPSECGHERKGGIWNGTHARTGCRLQHLGSPSDSEDIPGHTLIVVWASELQQNPIVYVLVDAGAVLNSSDNSLVGLVDSNSNSVVTKPGVVPKGTWTFREGEVSTTTITLISFTMSVQRAGEMFMWLVQAIPGLG